MPQLAITCPLFDLSRIVFHTLPQPNYESPTLMVRLRNSSNPTALRALSFAMPRPGRRKQLQSQPIHILDLTTTHWVDYNWLTAQIRRTNIGLNGHSEWPDGHAMKNAGRFRDYLLRIHQDGGGLRLVDFATSPSIQDDHSDPTNVSCLDTFAAEVASWTEKGRRLFRIDRSLQTLLKLTSLNNVKWEHVRWPFEAFAIELSQPIVDPTGKVWDFILVSTYNNEDMLLAGENGAILQMSFFSRANSRYDPIRADDRLRLQSLIARQEWYKAGNFAKQLYERFHRPVVIPRANFRYPKSKLTGLVKDTASHWLDGISRTTAIPLPEEALDILDAMIRIVVGLALYLKALPSGSSQLSKVNEPRRDGLPDVTIVTDKAQIFAVTSTIPLTREEISFEDVVKQPEAGGEAKLEMRTHWRQGYWSRKAGEGQNPDAEKSIWHRPTLVRADRLPKDLGLPAGAVTTDLDG